MARKVRNYRPPRGRLRDRKLLHLGHVFAVLAIVPIIFAMRELVDSQARHHSSHAKLLFFVAAGVAVVLGLGARLLVMVHRDREGAEFDERLRQQHERERGVGSGP